MKDQDLIDYLRDCGVCEICQLRYLKARGTEYQNVESTFKKFNVDYVATDEHEELISQNSTESTRKKQRLNICPLCLGLFSSTFQSRLIDGILATEISKFQFDNVVMAINMPMIIQIRQLSMWYALIRKFGEEIDTKRPPDVPLKEAVKLILNPIVCKILGKSYNADESSIYVNIHLTHPEEDGEVGKLKELHEALFRRGNGKKQPISRVLLEKQYLPNQISDDIFSKHINIPPALTTSTLCLESINLTGPTVFVAGRYRKITRELSHTPWVLDGKRVMDDSIEEIIMRSVVPFFECSGSKVIFMSSGREDVDVRCLGKGRPFVLEIPNAKRATLPRKVAQEMQLEIDKSLKVSVKDLQMVSREELVHIKTGEEKKRKYYRALCHLNEPITLEILQKLDLPNGFETQQRTPIRVLHRRPLHTRPRMIYSLKAFIQREKPHVLILDIVSQAGTYIKELVHGDFGRTSPSISSIIGQPIDIIALDVVAIDLDWPKEFDNEV